MSASLDDPKKKVKLSNWKEAGGVPDDYLPLPLSIQHYQAIGHVAAMWNAVEGIIQWLLWAIMDVSSETGRLLTASLRFETHLTIMEIVTATRPLSSEQKAEVASIIVEAKRLKDRRHLIVHSNWIIDNTDKPPRTHRLTIKGQSQSESFSAENIESIARESMHYSVEGSSSDWPCAENSTPYLWYDVLWAKALVLRHGPIGAQNLGSRTNHFF